MKKLLGGYSSLSTPAVPAYIRGHKKVASLVMCQRRCGAKKIFNFPIYHIASHFTHFQGIFNPLFEVKYKKNFSSPEQKTVTPLAYLFWVLS